MKVTILLNINLFSHSVFSYYFFFFPNLTLERTAAQAVTARPATATAATPPSPVTAASTVVVLF